MTARTGTSPTIAERWRSWTPYLLSVLRIVAAFLFIQFGTAKLYGFPAPIMPGGGTAPFGTLVWWASVFETYGGSLLLVGLYTRPVAFLLSGEMAVAYWMGHAPRGFFPVLNGGDAAILYCFIFLYIAFAGGGAWSLDRAIWKRD